MGENFKMLVPLYLELADGKVIGAIGETGGADEDVAKAGAAVLR